MLIYKFLATVGKLSTLMNFVSPPRSSAAKVNGANVCLSDSDMEERNGFKNYYYKFTVIYVNIFSFYTYFLHLIGIIKSLVV